MSRRPLAAVLVASVLLAAGCGARLDKRQLAQAAGGGQGGTAASGGAEADLAASGGQGGTAAGGAGTGAAGATGTSSRSIVALVAPSVAPGFGST